MGGNRHKAERAAVVLEWGARRTLRGLRRHRLLTLRTRNSAAYKGIYALLDKVAVDRVRNQEYVVPGDGSEDDRCGGQDAVYDE